MSTYAKKTCNICGLRDIQPNMYRRKKSVKAYTSKDKIGVGTMIGFAFDNKASRRRVNKALFANNKRSHTAHREVWMCYECSGVADAVRDNVRKKINKGEEVLSSACSTGWLSSPADEATQIKMAKRIESLRALEGETFMGVQQQAEDLVGELEFLYDMGKSGKGEEVTESTVSSQSKSRRPIRRRNGFTRLCVSTLRGFAWFWLVTGVCGLGAHAADGTLDVDMAVLAIAVFIALPSMFLKVVSKNT